MQKLKVEIPDPFYSAIAQGRRVLRRFCVAQIFNLLYRGIAFCAAFACAINSIRSEVLPIANRRYGRVQLCATLVAPMPCCIFAPLREARSVSFATRPARI
jgi:hypothetical protein